MSKLPEFTKFEIIEIFEPLLNKTLGEIDVKNEFDRTIGKDKITGITGDVVEVSVLNKEKDNDQDVDIIIDDIPTEVKTTGVRLSVKVKGTFEAKEPMTITAVSPNKILEETFHDSNFFKKINNMLIVYYYYESLSTVKASEYANFELRGYHIHQFSDEDLSLLKNDWEIVKEFFVNLEKTTDTPKEHFSKLSTDIKKELTVLDTAPKFPKSARFRLKRKFVNEIVTNHFKGRLNQKPLTKNERLIIEEESSLYNAQSSLSETYSSFQELDSILDKLTKENKGKSVNQLKRELGIEDRSKNVVERVFVRLFGGENTRINNIELFRKTSVQLKSVRVSENGLPCEDTKMFPIDFKEMSTSVLDFKDSDFFKYFDDNQFIFTILESKNKKSSIGESIFKGFVRYSFEETFVDDKVKKLWLHTRGLIIDNKLIDEITYKNDVPTVNKNGVVKSAPNFMKSSDLEVFVRGSGSDSSKKPEVVNEIKMYKQYVWLKKDLVSYILKSDKE